MDFVGKVITHVDIDPEMDQILLTLDSGVEIMIYHARDGCEHVVIEGTDGSWNNLLHKPILLFQHDETRSEVHPHYEYRTDTTLTFTVDGASVINRWVGTSNGYYSEKVDIRELSEVYDRISDKFK
jgi:hypothetical protein